MSFFYLFGLALLLVAGQQLRGELTASKSNKDDADNVMVRLARRFLPASDKYHGDKLFTRINGRRMMTPMLLVMGAIGATDLLFAFDSIPATFGLTQEPYIVFTATAFSLMGLRQLYFLIDGLLDRLVYLSYGLAATWASSGSNWCCTRCMRTTCRSSTMAGRPPSRRFPPLSPCW